MKDPVSERRISHKSFLPHYLGALVVGGAGIAIAMASGMPLLSLLAPLPLVAAHTYARVSRAGSCYRLFEDRLEVESGILSHRIENLELFRVRDVGLHQGLFGRLANFGDVYIHSTDSSAPDLHVRGIDSPQQFYQELRERVSASRAQGRTMIVEEGHFTPER